MVYWVPCLTIQRGFDGLREGFQGTYVGSLTSGKVYVLSVSGETIIWLCGRDYIHRGYDVPDS